MQKKLSESSAEYTQVTPNAAEAFLRLSTQDFKDKIIFVLEFGLLAVEVYKLRLIYCKNYQVLCLDY